MSSDAGELSRRSFLLGLGISAALAALPDALMRRGWLDGSAAADPDLTHDTLNGLVAFVTPGDDEYSIAQAVTTGGPGGIAAGATGAVIELLDSLLPAPLIGTALPAAAAVAQFLNRYAAEVDPLASGGGFPSPFARLSYQEKGEVFRRIESDPTWDSTPVRYLGGALIGIVALVTFSDAPRLKDGAVSAPPVGWQIAGYGGRSDGWDEFDGYWSGRTRARHA